MGDGSHAVLTSGRDLNPKKHYCSHNYFNPSGKKRSSSNVIQLPGLWRLTPRRLIENKVAGPVLAALRSSCQWWHHGDPSDTSKQASHAHALVIFPASPATSKPALRTRPSSRLLSLWMSCSQSSCCVYIRLYGVT
jgi:hypothetical protein